MSKVTLKQIREGLKDGIVLYFVHASWCPYTVQFYPIFDKTMEKLHHNKKDKLFRLIRLDDTMVKSIRANYNDIYRKLADYDENVDEYKLYFPTVVMFVNGKRYKYQVDVRTVKNFEEFIVSKLPKQKPLSRTTHTMRPLVTPRPIVRSTSRTPTQIGLHEQIDQAFKKLFK
jgi:thiol-disulfide isomerase/thioredoxin